MIVRSAYKLQSVRLKYVDKKNLRICSKDPNYSHCYYFLQNHVALL